MFRLMLVALSLCVVIIIGACAGPGLSVIPQSEHRTIRMLSLEDARDFAEIDLYYLGEEFNGLVIHDIQYTKEKRVFENSPPPLNQVLIVYAPPYWKPRSGDIPETRVTIEKATAVEIADWEASGRTVRNGELLPDSSSGGFRMELLFGESLVTLVGRSEGEVMKMQESLRRLN